MKKIILIFALFFIVHSTLNAQIKTPISIIENQLNTTSNLFMDASSYSNFGSSRGKGFGFPRTNLTQFTFNLNDINDLNIETAFDGMIVYNTATGNTTLGQGIVTAVTPGFYYFNNPSATDNITNGQWVRMLNNSDKKTDAEIKALAVTTEPFLNATTLTKADENSTNITYMAGKIGIGVATPTSKFEVNGASTNTSSYNAGASATIDFSQSNLARTTATPTAITLNGLKDGGTYTLAITSATGGIPNFTAAGLFIVKTEAFSAHIAGGRTLCTFVVIGTDVYTYVTPGFN